MSLRFDTDLGYGIRIKKAEAEEGRPAGHVVEMHFYNRSDAVKFAAELIHEITKRVCS
jgi:hypothetical protein